MYFRDVSFRWVNRPVHGNRPRMQIYRSSRCLSTKSRETSWEEQELGALLILTGTNYVSSLSYFNYKLYFKRFPKKKKFDIKDVIILLDRPYFIFDIFILEITKKYFCVCSIRNMWKCLDTFNRS